MFTNKFPHLFILFIFSVQSKVKEAYVIAVEDEAQKRLEKLSLLHKVQPVDMTKLASDTQETSGLFHSECK
jgi:hypothetical protein